MSSYNPRNKIATRTRLTEVRYEIRGELARRARELEGQGRTLILRWPTKVSGRRWPF